MTDTHYHGELIDNRHELIPLALNVIRTAAQVLIAIGVAVIAW